jgi:hypothetical protein
VRRLVPVALVLLCACGQDKSDPGPGPATADEASALGEAAEMLGERRLSPGQLHKAPDVDTAPAQGKDAQGVQGDAGR